MGSILDAKGKGKYLANWRKKNPGKQSEYDRHYRENMSEEQKEHRRVYSREYYHQNKEAIKEQVRRSTYKKLYGISLEDYDQMYEAQEGVCGICGNINSSGKRLCVDHNHDTGEVRGLLCTKCNYNLGWLEMLQDNIEFYLENS